MYTEFYGKLGLIRTSLSKVHKRKILQSNLKKASLVAIMGMILFVSINLLCAKEVK